jgi:predicted HicB family RNase H-like nuclease
VVIWSLRLPIELHCELIAQAAHQNVSLNTLMVAYLAREAGVEAHEGRR